MWNPFRFFKSEYYLNKGIKTYEKGDQEHGVSFLEKAISVDPHNELALINIGIAAQEHGNIEKAIQMFEKAAEISRYNPVPAARLAKIYFEKKDVKTALKYIEQSLACDVTYSEAYYIRGLCYIEQRMYDKAAENFEKIIVDNQNLLWARILVASELIIKQHVKSER